MIVDPATQTFAVQLLKAGGGSSGILTVEYVVIDGLNVVSLGSTDPITIGAFDLDDPIPGSVIPLGPLPAGQRYKITRVFLLSTDSEPEDVQTGAFELYGPEVEGAYLPLGGFFRFTLPYLHQLTYNDGVWTLHDGDGVAVSGAAGGGGDPAPASVSTLLIPFHADATAAITLTNQVQATAFLSASDRVIRQLDLAGYTECRIVARIVTGSASVNTPRLRAVYSTTYTTTVGSYADIGTSVVAASMVTAGVARSAWVPLAVNAAADAVFVAVVQEGGDAAADPVIGNVHLEFR
jgi:hypothetical protein